MLEKYLKYSVFFKSIIVFFQIDKAIILATLVQ